MSLRATLGVSLASFLVLTLPTPARPGGDVELKTIERVLAERGRGLVEALQRRGYGNVGVLKFLVSTDMKTTSDSVGTLNMLLAKQLELALVRNKKAKDGLGIIRNASARANFIQGASYRDPAGISKLFSAKYPLYVGNRSVPPDAFLTGLAVLEKDLSRMTVYLRLVDGKAGKLSPPLEGFVFKAKVDPSKLIAAGESFFLRGAFDGGDVDSGGREEKLQTKAVELALKAREKAKEHPHFTTGKPVTLQVLYNGEPAKITFKDGKARIPTPKLGTKIAFRLSRDSSQETYAVVLKLNGENTFGRQKLPDLHCRKWVLKPGAGGLIRGYQLDEGTRDPFEIKGKEESAKLAMDFGEHAGQISMTVYRQRKSEAPPGDPLDKYAADEEVLKKAELPEAAGSHAALLAAMEGGLKTRSYEDGGLIAGSGKREKAAVKTTKFDPDPTPVFSETIVYYTP